MIIFKTKTDIQKHLDAERLNGKQIAFIPTMGALHPGHISLITKAREDSILSVCSIFVNPAQFNEKEDFEKYPTSIEADIELLIQAGCNILFIPSVTEVYPQGVDKAASYNFGKLETIFEGAQRPGHFNGVGKVVALLLHIVQPDALYMGSKDYQQCMVVKELCRQLGLSEKVKFNFCPTTREPDGLAMSSRNRRLTEPQRVIAGSIYQCLVSIQSKFKLDFSFAIVQKECTELLKSKGFVPEYVAIADANTLVELKEFDANKKMIALIAVRLGNVRLIDNMLLDSE